MSTFGQDLKYAVRMLIKHRGFTFVAVLTLALGIGATSAIFTVVNAVLLRPMPFAEPERLVKIWESKPDMIQGTASVPNLLDWRAQNTVFTGIAAYQSASFALTNSDQPVRALGATVSGNFFEILGVQPATGRVIQQGEDEAGRDRVVVISDQLWRRSFGARANVVGSEITLDGETRTIVGIMPPDFRFPSRLTELWIPLVPPAARAANRGEHFYFALGRLKPGVTFERAQEEMRGIAKRIESLFPDQQSKRSILLIPLHEETVRSIRPALQVLMVAVCFVLLIACVNVANLLLARATMRRREIAIRKALGASRWRLTRQLLTESLLLAILGGAFGLLLGSWGTSALLGLATATLPRAQEVSLDLRVVLFTLTVSVVSGLVFGLTPALQASRASLQLALKEGGNAGEGPQRHWIRSALVITEIAASVVLLIGAGLLIRSFVRLQQADSGLRPENVATMSVALPPARYSSTEKTTAFFDELLYRLQTTSGFDQAGIISLLPFQQTGTNTGFNIEGRAPFAAGEEPLAEIRSVSPNYFRAIGIPLLAGRFFERSDRPNSEAVVIVNQTLARQYLGTTDVIGKRIRVSDNDWLKIVGVVGDVRQSGFNQTIRSEIHFPYTQLAQRGVSIVVRSSNDLAAISDATRETVRSIDGGLPVYNVKSMTAVMSDSVANNRVNALLLGIFASVALMLAIVGIYSVMSYTVEQNTREIGIRLAIGAERRDVVRLVLGQGLVLTSIGIVVGVGAAFAVTRLMESLLFGVGASDPMTLVAVPLTLSLVSIAACLIPAIRASNVDPLVALRHE